MAIIQTVQLRSCEISPILVFSSPSKYDSRRNEEKIDEILRDCGRDVHKILMRIIVGITYIVVEDFL